jgi:endonuclease/exonuclease/phosphatase family metal-dependent hydrolase
VIHEIEQLLEKSACDLACLQEVWQKQGVEEHQLDRHCRSAWHHHVFGRNAIFPNGSQGNATLSRFDLFQWELYDLSVGNFEKRGLLYGRIRWKKPVSVLNVHLGLFEREREKQVARIIDLVKTKVPPEEPLLLLGDFNDWREKLHDVFWKKLGLREVSRVSRGHSSKSFPSYFPLFSLDRIYARGLELLDFEVLKSSEWPISSDHLPVKASFKL